MSDYSIEINKLIEDGLAKINSAKDQNSLENIRVEYFGRKGVINDLLARLKDVPKEEKKNFGLVVNQAKAKIEEALLEAVKIVKARSLSQRINKEAVDVTMPGRDITSGRKHILTQTIEQVQDIFLKMGFDIAEGPEIEKEYYNFDALNIPKDHPARDMHDTIYIDAKHVLRTHTSPVQLRVMEKFKPPIAVICPGKAYRSDAIDASHSPMFHQMEGLMVDKDITFANLKQVLMDFASQMFGKDVVLRFRPSFFPFTEPSAEVDISCLICKQKGCRVCSNSGWLEILGSGMVNPKVFEYAGYEADKYSGFAFGMGIERIAMLKYRINDIRLFYENDIRFLRQF